MINDLKLRYYQTRNASKIPLLFSLWTEESPRRYYQYGSFLSNVLGMVDKNGNAFYGVEQYFDAVLRGKDWKIIGRSSSWVGNVWANDFQIDNMVNGNDIYLTIDIGIQKEIEKFNARIKAQKEKLDAQNKIIMSGEATTNIRKEMVKYTEEKGKYTDNLLNLYSFLNIVALGLLVYVYTAAGNE